MRRLDSGNLVDFNSGPLETNHVMFEVKGDHYSMAVNGVDIPLDIDAEDLKIVEEHVGRYRYDDDENGTATTTSPIALQPHGGSTATLLRRPEAPTRKLKGQQSRGL